MNVKFITELLAVLLTGGALSQILLFFRDKRRDKHKQQKGFRDDFQEELDKLRERIALLEERLEKQTEKIIVLERENSSLKAENKHLRETINFIKGDF